jgi:hypothetical protein
MTNQEIFVDGEYDYDLVIEDNQYKLFYSNAEHWTHKGELVLGLEDDGEGYKLIKPLDEKNRIDYSEAEELYILLSCVKESKIEIVESKRTL